MLDETALQILTLLWYNLKLWLESLNCTLIFHSVADAGDRFISLALLHCISNDHAENTWQTDYVIYLVAPFARLSFDLF